MSSSSESQMSFDSDDSDINFIPKVEIEHARKRAAVREERPYLDGGYKVCFAQANFAQTSEIF